MTLILDRIIQLISTRVCHPEAANWCLPSLRPFFVHIFQTFDLMFFHISKWSTRHSSSQEIELASNRTIITPNFANRVGGPRAPCGFYPSMQTTGITRAGSFALF